MSEAGGEPIGAAARKSWPRAELVLLAVALVPLFVGLGNDLQEFDPTQYAEAGRHMAEGGSWLRPQDNFGPYDDKPPLTFWLIAISIKALSATSFAVRLPSLACALFAVWATFLIGRELWDRRTGLFAAALFGSSPALHLLVADPKIDAAVTASTAFAVYFFLASRRRPMLGYAAWACAGAGLLAKGPIGVAVPLLAVLPEALRAGFWPSSPAAAPPTSIAGRVWRLKPILGPQIVALCFLPYALAAGPRLVYFHLWEQSFGRLTGQSVWRNTTGPLFFVHTALWAFLPFAPALLFALWSRLRAALRDRVLPADPRRVVLWWLLLPLLGISLSRYKLPQYLYWLGPPAALLAARALFDLALAAPRSLRALLVAVQIAVIGAAAVLPAVVLAASFPASSTAARIAWTLLGLLAGAAALAALRRLPLAEGLAGSGVLSLTAALFFFHGHLHPAVLGHQPDHALAAAAAREDPSARVLPFVGAMPTNAAGFYARRDVRPFAPIELVKAVGEGAVKVAIVDVEALPTLASAGLSTEPILELPAFPTSKPTAAFLLQRTRPGVVRHLALVRLRLSAAPRATR